jgi:uncharacterized protein involved in cysteine biosynthesis
MATGSNTAADHGETEKERLDRNLQDLLQGLRVALPGVQVLFAFLLVVPFQQAFAQVTDFQEDVYFTTLIATALASVFLIAPSARHRARFREGDKRWVVMTGNRLATAGFGFLGLAICGALLLITDILFSLGAALVVAVGLGALLAWLWFASPFIRDIRGLDDESD